MQRNRCLGSSPRIRGECDDSGNGALASGIIPANTGRIIVMPANTGRIDIAGGFVSKARDHPREYGENQLTDLRGCLSHGIIPANTGRIGHACQLIAEARDHPREYGENDMPIPGVDIHPGSSPRIRGECVENPRCMSIMGIIPANTERMRTRAATRWKAWDHPREYGENGD